MTEQAMPSASGHRWYSRPVLFVADLNRAVHFYVDQLGFEKNWHAGEGAGTVCQVSRSDCEIILCQDPARRDKSRLFIELTAEGLSDFRREVAERSVPARATWWGYDTMQVNDPDGNELLFPVPE
jgi:catechol 2,3-dioxygenase-like lactoylglutathione lyase family enzyme